MIQVSDRYRIVSHPFGWTIEKFMPSKKTGGGTWPGYRYLPTFPKVVDCMAEILLREAPATDLSELKQAAVTIADLLEGICNPPEPDAAAGEEVEWVP